MTPAQEKAIRNLKAQSIANCLRQLDTLFNELDQLTHTIESREVYEYAQETVKDFDLIKAAQILEHFVSESQGLI